MSEPRFCYPTPTRDFDIAEPLTGDQVDGWRSSGFALVDGLLPAELITRLQTAATAEFPPAGTDETDGFRDFGSAVNFPNRLDGFNEVTLHSRLLAAVAQLLRCPVANLRLSQSDLWPKYGHSRSAADQASPSPRSVQDNQDQRIHFDYPNHTLVHPSPWDRPEAVEMIIYLSDVDDSGGSTAVVPRDGDADPAYRWPLVDTPGVGDLRYVNDRTAAEEYFAAQRPELADWRQSLYERERWTHFRPGTIVLYRHDLWHRGTPLKADGFRLAHNITYRRAECEWIGTLHVGWSWAMYRDDKHMERLIASSTEDQRTVLGFPAPGSKYWCPETLDAVEARYRAFGIDMKPYRSSPISPSAKRP